MIMNYNGWSGSNVVTDVLQESRCPTTGPLSSPSQPLSRDLTWLLTEVSLTFISRQLLREDKARMFYRCDRLFFQGFNAYPWRTFRYTNASKLG